ncbi:alpha-ketoglutarate-dependent 2,4-dichlorophenoxyacetate dioxygenase [Aulographum hederae CBS 113979]|uniref:Alpha-ketoglutarate-dependent 2,4-dichlorophenoxyacetate dioxygenase n=1 Tax=Aulographum hederae CBS 113979 TaxID=1176131 RepID=A0A6G1GZH9_9PEZI|nr:alpha-ketoglutarate-dependent 2,4-dichlorophenoxyacetate dioxygenase [Aulographum hederae CBS 113979]
MPGVINQSEFSLIKVKELHPTFAAEVSGIDFSKDIPDDVFAEIYAAAAKYGVLAFRNAIYDDHAHVAFSARFGELDDIKPYIAAGRKNRFACDQLFDVSNMDDDGNLLANDTPRAHAKKGNGLFHVDSSFNPRRAGYSLLRAVELPPPNTGGETEYADTRAAWDDLDEDFKQELLEKDYIVHHCLWQSRKAGSPEFYKDIKPEEYPMSRHKLIQTHEPSGRKNIYIAAHAHHIEGLSYEESRAILDKLYKHSCQKKYTISVPWENNGDVVLWDNTCVMHRAAGGSYAGKYKRDMRRATVHDMSSTAWGLNPHVDTRQGFP